MEGGLDWVVQLEDLKGAGVEPLSDLHATALLCGVQFDALELLLFCRPDDHKVLLPVDLDKGLLLFGFGVQVPLDEVLFHVFEEQFVVFCYFLHVGLICAEVEGARFDLRDDLVLEGVEGADAVAEDVEVLFGKVGEHVVVVQVFRDTGQAAAERGQVRRGHQLLKGSKLQLVKDEHGRNAMFLPLVDNPTLKVLGDRFLLTVHDSLSYFNQSEIFWYHPICRNYKSPIIITFKEQKMATLSPQPFNPSFPPLAQPQPLALEALPQVKQECDRPQAIYINCNPSLLPHLISTVRQFCHKYLDSTSSSTIDSILRKLSKVQETIARFPGIRELVAAVVYCQYSDLIRLKLKDYSSLNQLNQKLFNKKYVAYQTILKREGSRGAGNTVKIEQKLEDEKEEGEERVEREGEELRGVAIGSRKQAIELIYDGVFQSPYFQDNRREIIEKMAERCEEIDEKIFQAMDWTHSRTLKLYYAIYAFLKTLGMNVGFTKYREAVHHFAGYVLKRNLAALTQRVMKAFCCEEVDSNESSDSVSPQ